MNNIWFTIVNPISGNGKVLKKLEFIQEQFKILNISVKVIITSFKHEEELLVQNAIKQGYRKFISIGGDGTLHHIVNGIMRQKYVSTNLIKVAVIPVGTGNDWVRTYHIPKNIKQSIAIIKKEESVYQDIGKIHIKNHNKYYYFNNLAGLGFDGFVVKRINTFKKFGSIAYLLGALSSFINYKKSEMHLQLNNKKITSKIFMLSVGLCKYSGGGMQLTDYNNNKTNLFDITVIKNITLFKIVLNINKLFNGKIIKLKEVETLQEKYLDIKIISDHKPYIQADGELLGKGDLNITILNNAIQFIVKNVKI